MNNVEKLPIEPHEIVHQGKERPLLRRIAMGVSSFVLAATLSGDGMPTAEASTIGHPGGRMSLGNDIYVDVSCDDRENLTPNLTSVVITVANRDASESIYGTLQVGDQTDKLTDLRNNYNYNNQILRFPTTADNMKITLTTNDGFSNSMTSGCKRNPDQPVPSDGYWMVNADGAIYSFGLASDYASGMRNRGDQSVKDIEGIRSSKGYWLVDRIGEVSARGSAIEYGDKPPLAVGEEVTSLSGTPSDRGYWLFTNKGRVVAYGDAQHHGDMAGTKLNGPVQDSIPTPTGNGYYMVASDGGVFTFGDAKFAGSMGDKKLNKPVESLVPDADSDGYWLVAGDGGIFTFDAGFYGSMGDVRLNKPVTGMVAGPGGRGYLMVAEDGGIFTFGEVKFRGSEGGATHPSTFPVVSVSAFDKQA